MSEENARLAISLLGPYRVALDGRPVTRFKSDKTRALLAYLAVEAKRPHPRRYLAGLLWPEYPEQDALASLRTALASMRSAIGDRTTSPPLLDISRQTLQFNLTSSVWLDVDTFDTLLGAPGVSESMDRPGVQQLQKAIELYQGEFLEGFSLPDCVAFEEWVLNNRERLHHKVLQALHRLTEYHEQYGECDLALRYARRQLEMDPLQERAHRQVMRLLALSDQRAAAMDQYERCRQVLKMELGVEPAEQTTALNEQIRTGKLERPPPSDSPSPPVVPGSGQADTSHTDSIDGTTPTSGPSSTGRRRQRRRWVSIAITIAVLCLAAGLIIWLMLRPPPPPKSPLAVVASTEAHVEVKRANTRQVILASFGMPLYSGDVVYTHDQAAATVICYGGLTYILGERKSLTIDCEQIADTQIRVEWLDPDLVDQSDLVTTPTGEGLSADETRASRGVQEATPLLLSPRNTVITDTRPSFHWQPVAGAAGYRLELIPPVGEKWIKQTQHTSLSYPTDEPALRLGSAYATHLAVLYSSSVPDKTSFEVLDEASLARVTEAEVAIAALGIDETSRRYLLAQLYREWRMWAAAADQLEWLIRHRGVDSAYLFQQLGDLHVQVGLYLQAEENYHLMLDAAAVSADWSAQAAAHVRLAQVTHVLGEIEAAVDHLTTAEHLYRQAGETDRAGAVATARAELME